MRAAGLYLITVATALAGVAAAIGAAQAQQPNCGYYTNSKGHEVPRPCGNWRSNRGAPPDRATALCGDWTYSFSEHPYASGTCSHHGGVVKHLQ
jgi:Protein of unknown function (DUF3761)